MEDKTEFVLWFRKDEFREWRPAFRAATSQECVNMIGVIDRNGDWLTLPAGQDANGRKAVR